MIRLLQFLLILSLTLSCTKSEIATRNHKEVKHTYLALGDSYTIGEGVAATENWPNILAQQLTDHGINFEKPKIIATTGWTTGELIKAIEAENLKTYDLVSLLIGVNNQYRGQDFKVYQEEFSILLKKAINLAGNKPERVFVVSIPDYSVTPFGQSRESEKIAVEIEKYNDYNYSVASEMGVSYFNITPISKSALNNSGLLAADALHPSGKMYQQWVDLIFPVVKNFFQ